MPLVGLGGYMLSKHGRNKSPQTPTAPVISGEFFKVKISTTHDKINGRLSLNFDTYRISYDGIKVRLSVHLKSQATTQGNVVSNDIDLFKHCPIETTLPCNEFRGQKKFGFTLNIPKNRMCPTPFISSNGSLTYRLVALIKRYKDDPWIIITNKLLLLDFKGYYNVGGMDFGPSVDFKLFLDGKITSIFTLLNPVLLMGHGTNINANLELQGVLDYNVDVAVSFLRKIKCGENVQTEIISLQKQIADCNEENALFKWNFDIPLISKVTFANELYSVRYFFKYELTFKPLSDEKGICVDGHGIVEVKVGTTTESNAPDNSCTSTMTIDCVENLMQLARRSSVTSMITLPPAYSQLSSNFGSLLSLETLPPSYDDL